MSLLRRYYSLIRELFLYGVIGCFSAAMDVLSFTLLSSFGIQLLAANFISVNIGIALSFLLNTYLNFKKRDRIKNRMIKFFTVGYAGLLLSMAIMWTGVNMLGGSKMMVKIISVFAAAVIQYLLNKYVTFRN